MKSYYSKKIINHFLHPKNMGKIKDANGIGDTQNLKCGDIMKVYIKVENLPAGRQGKVREIIKDAKFETFGCGHAIAISDMICDLVKGKTINQALKVSYKDVLGKIGSVPPQKVHCAYLAQEGVRMAVENYKKRKK